MKNARPSDGAGSRAAIIYDFPSEQYKKRKYFSGVLQFFSGVDKIYKFCDNRGLTITKTASNRRNGEHPAGVEQLAYLDDNSYF